MNLQGQVVYQEKFSQTADTQINLSGLANGVYVLEATTDKEILRTKIVLSN